MRLNILLSCRFIWCVLVDIYTLIVQVLGKTSGKNVVVVANLLQVELEWTWNWALLILFAFWFWICVSALLFQCSRRLLYSVHCQDSIWLEFVFDDFWMFLESKWFFFNLCWPLSIQWHPSLMIRYSGDYFRSLLSWKAWSFVWRIYSMLVAIINLAMTFIIMV